RSGVGSFVGEHRLSRDVANGVDAGLGGPPLEVDFDEAARVDLNLGFVQAGNARIRLTPYRHEDLVENLRLGWRCGSLELDPDSVFLFFHLGNLRAEHDGPENLLHAL